MRTLLLIISGLLVLAFASFGWWQTQDQPTQQTATPTPTTVASPSLAPSPSLNPTAATSDQAIILNQPQPESTITSPLTVSGQAPGPWFFEGQFDVILTDWDGRIIAETPAEAETDWMTTDLVPFTAELSFTQPQYGDRGTLILRKANPSGLPENDAAHEITVYFR